MKNLKSVSALVLLALSFTACEKNDLVPTPAPPPAAERLGQVILPTWNLVPTEIRDAAGMVEKTFKYDSKNRLTSLYNVGDELLTFEYSTSGLLLRVNNFASDAINTSRTNAKFDLYAYENPKIKKPTKISRYENNTELSDELAKVQPSSIIEITYDVNLNKVSEKEFTFLGNGLGKGIVREHRYTYDSRNNVTSTSFFEQGILKGIVQFKLYDSYRNILTNVPVLNLVPFQFTGSNNATLIMGGDLPEAKTGQLFVNHKISCGEEVQKKFIYNDFGYPESETTITRDGSYTVNITYNQPD